MATLAAYPAMIRRSRQRLGLRECRAAWLLGVTVRQYRQFEAGAEDAITADVWERMVEVFGWPQRRSAMYGDRLTSDSGSVYRGPSGSARGS
jgi:hypothetical protein